MITVGGHLFSWSFLVGVLVGFTLSRLLCLYRVIKLDREHPLPSGRHRSRFEAIAIDPRWFAGAIAVTVAAWSIIQTQHNADEASRITAEARQFAADTRACQADLIESIVTSRRLNNEYNALSAEQRNALADWLNTLLNPPAEIAALDGTDPVRQHWAVGVTAQYFSTLQRSQREQADNDEQKQRNPLPDPECK